jgi:hypothetical protein
MGTHYHKNAATYDADAKSVTLRGVCGDTFEAWLDAFIERPNPYVAGEVIEDLVDMSDLAWDSLIYDGNHTPRLTFNIVDDPYAANRITIGLTAYETAQLVPGTYGWWLEATNLLTNNRRTWIRGTLTITEKPVTP